MQRRIRRSAVGWLLRVLGQCKARFAQEIAGFGKKKIYYLSKIEGDNGKGPAYGGRGGFGEKESQREIERQLLG